MSGEKSQWFRKISALLVATSLLPLSSASLAATISFEPSELTLEVGESALVSIVVSDIPPSGLAAFQFTTEFDQAVAPISDPNDGSPFDPFQPLGRIKPWVVHGVCANLVRVLPNFWFLLGFGVLGRFGGVRFRFGCKEIR